jgi:hypothetical protein
MPKLNGINLSRGLRGAGIAAAVGVGFAIPLSAVARLGVGFCIIIGTMFAFAGWATYAPHGKHRILPALIVLFLCTFIVGDVVAMQLPASPYMGALILIGVQLIAAAIFTETRVRTQKQKDAEQSLAAESR